jgi:hypothetical protein
MGTGTSTLTPGTMASATADIAKELERIEILDAYSRIVCINDRGEDEPEDFMKPPGL